MLLKTGQTVHYPFESNVKHFFNREWWANLSTNFLGALLGIIVTFGTTGYLEYKEKKGLERKAVLMTVSNIEFSIDALKDAYNSLQQYDTVFTTVRKHYPDKLAQVPEDTLFMYINRFTQVIGFIIDPSAEGIFTHSSDIWRTLDNPTLQQRIGHCFAFRNRLYDLLVDIARQQKESAGDFFSDKFLFDYRNTAEIVQKLTDRPSVRNFLALYPSIVRLVRSNLRELEQMNERNKQDIRMTEEEYAKYYLQFYNEDYGEEEEPDSLPPDPQIPNDSL